MNVSSPGGIFQVRTRAVVPTMAEVGRYRCDLYTTVYDWLAKNGGETTGPELALYHNDAYVEENVEMEAALPVRKSPAPDGDVGVYELPAIPEMASTMFEGESLWDIPGAVAALFAWAGENGYSSAGPMREVHHFGRELDHEDYASLVMEVQLPVVKQ